jgi:F0F1-type ATP synthase membrane subunit c/vacuolar-type H+-ATPase subunit K
MGKHVALLLIAVFLTASCITMVESASALSPNSWASKSPMPTARAFFGVAVVDGKIYAMGGADGVNEVYDPVTDTWVTKKPTPNPRTSFAIAACENKIYVIGGYTNWSSSKGAYLETNMTEVYDPATDSWGTKASMPTARGQMTASAVDGKIYVIGGIEDPLNGRISNLNEVYDPATNTWTTKLPIPYGVYSHCSAAMDNKIYVISGQSDDRGQSGSLGGPLNQIYNTETNTWTLGAAPPQPAHRSGAAATSGVSAPKRIYVLGGEVDLMEATNINQVYNPQTDAWNIGAPMPTARQGLCVAVVNDIIYAFGGSYPAESFSTAALNKPQRQYTMLVNAKASPVNFIPQTQSAVNEQYTPLGYGNTPFDEVPVQTEKMPALNDHSTLVSVLSPANITYNMTSVPLTFMADTSSFKSFCYSIDGQENVTAHENVMLTGLSEGPHKLSLFAVGFSGQVVWSGEIYFSIAKQVAQQPEPFPSAGLLFAGIGMVIAIFGFGFVFYLEKRGR